MAYPSTFSRERIAVTERSFVRKDGSLNMAVLLERFTQFYSKVSVQRVRTAFIAACLPAPHY